MKYSDEELEKLWREFDDVPFDEDKDGDLILAVDWNGFEKGTDRETIRETIWHWFDVQHSKGVHYLFYGQE